jgi:hypothetical protein
MSMSEPQARAQALAAAAAVGLKLDPAHLPGVTRFLMLAAEMADTLDAAPLDPDDDALAPVLRLPDMEPR